MKRYSTTTAFSVLLLGAALVSCSKEPGETPAPETGPEIKIMANVVSDAESKAPVDGTTSLELQFLRSDETTSGTYGAYGTAALPATRTAGSGARAISFTTKQYYMLSGLNTKLVGYHPAATSYTGGVVSWTVDGTKDILTAPAQEGNHTNAMPGFTFAHKLTQLQFYPYCSDAAAATIWGKVMAVKVTGQRTACTFTPASDGASGAVAFSGGTSALTVSGGTAVIPNVGTAAAEQFGNPVMIESQAGSYELNVTVTTEKGGDLTMKVPARAYPAGAATKVYLKFTAHGLIGDAEIADWATPEDYGAVSMAVYVPLYYGNAFQNGGVVTGLSGSATGTYDGYTEASNGTRYATAAAAYAGEKPYYQLEVALSDEPVAGNTYGMTWEQAWRICKNKLTDGGGWRMPRLSEMRLMYLNKSSLESEDGFTAFAASTYWSGTEVSATNVFSLTMNSGSEANTAKTGSDGRVRCVREPRRIGKVANGGAVLWIDPADPTHYKVVAFADQGSGLKWAVNGGYVIGDAGRSSSDGLSNQAAVVAYAAAKGINLQSGFPAFWACASYDSGDGVKEWFLPSTSELKTIFQNRGVLYPVFTANGGGGCASKDYWTSTENTYNGTNHADNIYMGSGGSYLHNAKTTGMGVRCIREVNR